MRKMCRMIFGTAALALMLCLTGLVISGEAQAQRFVDNGNKTVTDTVTGLMWTKDANLFGELNWDDAIARCDSFSISGIDGWWLPTRDQLMFFSHALADVHPFTGIAAWPYWTSTRLSSWIDNRATVIVFLSDYGFSHRTRPHHVWCVRRFKYPWYSPH
jgi:hypothetical protein